MLTLNDLRFLDLNYEKNLLIYEVPFVVKEEESTEAAYVPRSLLFTYSLQLLEEHNRMIDVLEKNQQIGISVDEFIEKTENKINNLIKTINPLN